jgi:hypothetical protein
MSQNTLENSPAVRNWWDAYYESFKTMKDGPWLSYIDLMYDGGRTYYVWNGLAYKEVEYLAIPEVKHRLLWEAIRNLK